MHKLYPILDCFYPRKLKNVAERVANILKTQSQSNFLYVETTLFQKLNSYSENRHNIFPNDTSRISLRYLHEYRMIAFILEAFAMKR